jgi:uncharacterized protein (DUF1015 family)
MTDAGVLVRDSAPLYYVYRLHRLGRVQTGLGAAASVADYNTNRIRKHELTTPVKEDDRVRQIEAVNAQTGPVMIAYPNAPAIDAILAKAAQGEPEVDVTADDGVRHQMWPVRDAATIDALTKAFDALPAIYIADGHHRSAAASRIAAARGGKGPHDYFLSVIFPHHEMLILDYNRLVKDLNGKSADQFLTTLREKFTVTEMPRPTKPQSAGSFAMYLAGKWYTIELPANLIATDPIGRLPVTLLTKNIIEPMLGIMDQRRDKRIDFVGGARGLEGLSRRVDSGEMAVAFALYPTQMDDLMAVADAGLIMPPKSTWFEPKLADGMISHVLD